MPGARTICGTTTETLTRLAKAPAGTATDPASPAGCAWSQHELEELDCVVECEKSLVVQVGRRILDAAQREGLDRAVGGGEAANYDLRYLEMARRTTRQIVRRRRETVERYGSGMSASRVQIPDVPSYRGIVPPNGMIRGGARRTRA